MMQPGRGVVVTHGGAGSSRDSADGCEAAGRLALQQLSGSGSSLDAVVAAVVSLEDDSRFNAGTGSHLGLDGKTVELDAAVMDTRGKLGPLRAWERYAITGIGEYIVRQMLARTVYDWIEAGEPLQNTLERAVRLFTLDVDVGLIGVTETEATAASNRDMPFAVMA